MVFVEPVTILNLVKLFEGFFFSLQITWYFWWWVINDLHYCVIWTWFTLRIANVKGNANSMGEYTLLSKEQGLHAVKRTRGFPCRGCILNPHLQNHLRSIEMGSEASDLIKGVAADLWKPAEPGCSEKAQTPLPPSYPISSPAWNHPQDPDKVGSSYFSRGFCYRRNPSEVRDWEK